MTQITFIKAYENYHAFNHESTLLTWLFSIATNNLQNEYRKKHRHLESIDKIEHHPNFVSFEFTENVELRIDISRALQHLKKLNQQFQNDIEVNDIPSATAFLHLTSINHSVGSNHERKKAYQDIIDHLSLHAGQIFNLLEYRPSQKITSEIYENLQTFHQAVNESNAPNWFIGIVEGNTIKVTFPLQPGAEHTYKSILKSIIHLFTICLVKEINPSVPKWIYQGLGGYQAKLMTESYINRSIVQLVEQGQIPSFGDLDDNSWEFETKKGFQLSYTLVEFVIKQYGVRSLNKLIRCPSNLENIFGCSSAEFHHNWKEALADRFKN